jgi:hypothetical protein
MCGALAPDDAANECVLKEDGESRARAGPAFLYYNFVRIHKTLKVRPAMAAGVTSRLWESGDIVGALESWEAAK